MSSQLAEILDQLDPVAISVRLDEIRAEREALLVLLRAARHRQRGRPRAENKPRPPAGAA